MAVGSVAQGLTGFIQSHEGAQSAQSLLAQSSTDASVAFYEDARLPLLLLENKDRATMFVHEVLGDLAAAPWPIRDSLCRYLREGGNISLTAQSANVHRNTMMKRLARAESLLPRPLSRNRTEVAAALDLLHWLPDQQG